MHGWEIYFPPFQELIDGLPVIFAGFRAFSIECDECLMRSRRAKC